MRKLLTGRAGLAGLALALAACGGSAPDAPAVVLITCDTLRADHLGFLGCPRGTSPSLDALARESRVFEAAWSTAPLTGPALSALLTGRPPEELGLADNRTVLAAEALTLAERLAAAGVDTAAIVSNWVLRERPELPGAGVRQGFAHYDDRMESHEASRPDLKERLAPDTTDAALAWLDARDAGGPFFLWVHYQDPHGPYTAPAELVVAPEDAEGEPELEVGNDQRGRGVLPAYQVVDDERRPAAYRARYDAEIRYFDREVGRLLDGLRARGVLERALVAFTADHGESLGERGFWFSHGQHLHQELVRVPLLVRGPRGAGARREVAPASHLDLYPTVLRFLGVEPGRVHGTDLLADALPADRVLPQFLRGGWSATGARHRLVAEHGTRQLFDLASDPGEERDVAAANPELVEVLQAGHRAFVQAPGLPPLEPARAALDADAERTLDALGYGGNGEGGEAGPDDDGDGH